MNTTARAGHLAVIIAIRSSDHRLRSVSRPSCPRPVKAY
jgi:hypothetical protein